MRSSDKTATEVVPDGDVVVDGLCVEHGEVDVDAVAWRHSDAPYAVFKIGVVGRVARRVDGPIEGCDITTAKS